MSAPEVAISGIGLTTSLGWTATQACAAARAGLSRTVELGLSVEDEEGDDAAVLGHPIALLTDGFSGIGRYARMCLQALDDLLGRSGDGGASAASTGFYLHVNDHYHYRALAASEQQPDDPQQQEQEHDERSENPTHDKPSSLVLPHSIQECSR